MNLEPALLAGGFLKTRCGEAVYLMCPSCGSCLGDGILLESMANGLRCSTCAATINLPHAKCLRCGEGLAAPGSSERDCHSASVYRRGEAQPAFAPPEPLWVLQGASPSDATVLTESSLGSELRAGRLAGGCLIRPLRGCAFASADTYATFRDLLRAAPPTSRTPRNDSSTPASRRPSARPRSSAAPATPSPSSSPAVSPRPSTPSEARGDLLADLRVALAAIPGRSVEAMSRRAQVIELTQIPREPEPAVEFLIFCDGNWGAGDEDEDKKAWRNKARAAYHMARIAVVSRPDLIETVQHFEDKYSNAAVSRQDRFRLAKSVAFLLFSAIAGCGVLWLYWKVGSWGVDAIGRAWRAVFG